jgi:hypothetical protein
MVTRAPWEREIAGSTPATPTNFGCGSCPERPNAQ